MEKPFIKRDEDNTDVSIDNGNGKNVKSKSAKDTTFYTGNKSKHLLVHIMQDGLEVDKPINTKIYNTEIRWRERQYPIVPDRFVYDYKGTAHQYVDVNDVAVLTWKKDHEDKCRNCGGKMTVDARESRALGRRGIFNAIWALDNTHIMLMIVLLIGAVAMGGAFFWAYNQDTLHSAQLKSSQQDVARLNNVITQYQNITGIEIPVR